MTILLPNCPTTDLLGGIWQCMLEEGAGAEGRGMRVCAVVLLMADSGLVSDAVGSCVE